MKRTKITLLSLLAVIVLSCTSPTENFNIHLSPTFYKYVIEVELYDIIDPDTRFAANTTVAISGQDGAGIYNIDGTKNVELNFGSLQLMVERSFEPLPGAPLKFTLTLNANDYNEIILPITIEEADYFQKLEVGMLNPNNLPAGITNSTKTATVTTSGQLSQPLVIQAGSNDSLSKVEMTVPNDITFSDADGNQVTGSNLNVNILSLSDTSVSAQQALPNGGSMVQTVMVNGAPVSLVLPPSATFKVDMDMGGTAITQFSGQGVQMKIDIPNNMLNEDFDRAYQAGDSVTLISNSAGDAAWENDGTFLVQDDGQGNLFVDPNITHLSFKKIVSRNLLIAINASQNFDISHRLKPGTNTSPISGNYAFLVFVQRGGNPRFDFSFRRTKTSTITATKSALLSIPGLAKANNVIVIIPTSFGTINSSLYDITFTDVTASGTTIEVNPKGVGVDVSFSLYCAGDNAIIDPPAGVKMFYKKSSDVNASYQHLYTFTQQNITVNSGRVYQLEDNTDYDFRALFNDTQVDTNNVTVIDGTHYNVTLPASACAQLF